MKLTKFIMPIVTILAIIVAISSYTQLNKLKQDPQAQAKKENSDLVDKVSKLLVLPTDETPTIATVSDPEALKDQAFFTGAVKGDKVLIYTNAKKAILYSVSTNKILDVAPLNIGNGAAAPAKTNDAKPATTTVKAKATTTASSTAR